MGANAATKCHRVVNNLESILAVELLTAFQALDFRKQQTGLKSSGLIETVMTDFRQVVSFNDGDRLLRTDLQESLAFIQGGLKKHLGNS